MFHLLSLFGFFICLANAQVDSKLSKNLSLQSLQKDQESKKVSEGFLGRSFLPSLTLMAGQERFQTGKYETLGNPYGLLEARFNLFRGGRDKLEEGIRILGTRIGSYNMSTGAREELNKVRKLEWQITYNNELLKILEIERKGNERIREQATRRAKSGVASTTDALEFSIYESELEEAIESLTHENKILKIGLLPHLGLDSEESLNFSQSLDHEHDEEIMVRTYTSQNHPDVSRLNAEFEVYALEKESSNRWWTPSLELYGGYYLYTLRDRDYLAIREREDRAVGIRVTFELFDGFQSYNQSTVTHYQAESKKLMARHLQRQTDAKYRMLQEDLKHTHEVMHYVEDRIKKSKDYLKATLSEYDRGVKNSLDALTAMQRYYRYEKQFLERKKEYQIIKADILAILGE